MSKAGELISSIEWEVSQLEASIENADNAVSTIKETLEKVLEILENEE